jgi:hypothetical protein
MRIKAKQEAEAVGAFATVFILSASMVGNGFVGDRSPTRFDHAARAPIFPLKNQGINEAVDGAAASKARDCARPRRMARSSPV